MANADLDHITQEMFTRLSRMLTVVPKSYVDAILILHQKLDDKNINWILDGDLAECLKTVPVEPKCIEIVCSKQDSEEIFSSVEEFKPSPQTFQVIELGRNAVINERELPVNIRSHYFDFYIKSVLVKVHGDLQFQVNGWDWGDFFLFEPDYVYVVGKKTAVTPLIIRAELYGLLGWFDRVEKIKQVTDKARKH